MMGVEISFDAVIRISRSLGIPSVTFISPRPAKWKVLSLEQKSNWLKHVSRHCSLKQRYEKGSICSKIEIDRSNWKRDQESRILIEIKYKCETFSACKGTLNKQLKYITYVLKQFHGTNTRQTACSETVKRIIPPSNLKKPERDEIAKNGATPGSPERSHTDPVN